MFNFFKLFHKNDSKYVELILEEKATYLSILSNIKDWLESSGNKGQVEVIEFLLQYLNQSDIPQFKKLLNSVDMWGGSGAVWEVGIKDEILMRKFQSEIIKLINLMDKTKILRRGIKSRKKLFLEDLNKR